jgi:hypothetical protein
VAKFFPEIDDDHRKFIADQHMFFVASAPLSADGHVNLSPKGQDCLRVLGPSRVAYLDLTGSGNETSAHLRENGRITLMFCAFAGPPKILRLFGHGEAVLPASPLWDELFPLFEPLAGARQIILIDVSQVQTSCGFAVPNYKYVGQRDTLNRWAEAKGEDGLAEYRRQKNTRSIDGLPTPLGECE